MNTHLINANTLQIPLRDKSVHMICTSPPYWGLRDYGVGDQLGLEPLHDCQGWATGNDCGECYICHTRQWAAEVWRVLRDDGIFWLNLGDSYAANRGYQVPDNKHVDVGNSRGMKASDFGLKPKDLCMMPARVALALQADGWYVRSDIIWSKPNPMPESVTDRPTKAHEYIFLLTKSARYFYDADAVREEHANTIHTRNRYKYARGKAGGGPKLDINQDINWKSTDFTTFGQGDGNRNRRTVWKVDNTLDEFLAFCERSGVDIPAMIDAFYDGQKEAKNVWHIATQPFSGAHFATWPEKLVEPMIKAGTSERGVCPECGNPWERVVEKESYIQGEARGYHVNAPRPGERQGVIKAYARARLFENSTQVGGKPNTTRFIGFRPTCAHSHDPVPAIVLDPFAGSGTTGVVARRLGRHFVGLDLSFDYLTNQAKSRLSLDALEEYGQAIEAEENWMDTPLFRMLDNDTPAL